MTGIKNMEQAAVLTLKEQVAYQPGQVVSKTLAQNDAVQPQTHASASSRSDKGKVYKVKKGDSLYKIARKVYGDGALWSGAGKLDMAKVKAVDPVAETWHGSVHVGFNATRGNTYDNSAAIVANVNRRWEKDRFTSNFGYFFAQNGTSRDNKEKTEDRIELAAQEDHFWTAGLYSYINGKYERDGINDLQYRYRVGVGAGYQWLDGKVFDSTGKWSFNQEVGLTYIKEKYEHIDDDDRLAFRYAHHLVWAPCWVDKLAFTHNLEYLPDTENWAESYLIDADVGFTYELTTAWQLMGKAQWNYNSNPGPSTKSSDFRYMLGLGYKW